MGRKQTRQLVLNAAAAPVLNVEPHAYQTVTANSGPMTRFESLEGKNYMVVPMVMLTEGVHAGSNGPLYYPRNELAKTPAIWNHKPVVVYHPTQNGAAISACEPAVIQSRKVGIIMNTRFEPGKGRAPGRLKAEAWLDTNKLKQVDARVLNALSRKEMVEVSTGLFTDNEYTPGHWNGEKYSAIATNYRADHLAILPDEKGACSIADGAGLLRNSSERPEIDSDWTSTALNHIRKTGGATHPEIHQLLVEKHGIDRADPGEEERWQGGDTVPWESGYAGSALTRRVLGRLQTQGLIRWNKDRSLYEPLHGTPRSPSLNSSDPAWQAEDHVQDPSQIPGIHKVIAEKIKKSPTLPSGLKHDVADPWVKDVYPTFAIFQWQGRTFSQPIAGGTSVDGVRLTGKPVPVKLVQRPGYTVMNTDTAGGGGVGEEDDEKKEGGEESPMDNAVTTNTVPGIAKWNVFAGGMGAPEGKNSYSYKADHGEYHISPVGPRGYSLQFAHTNQTPETQGLYGTGLWTHLGMHSSPAAAASQARQHAGMVEEKPMTKNQLIASLIANRATAWTEADRETLNAMPAETLAKMLPVHNGDVGTFPLTGPSGRAREPSMVVDDGHRDDNGETIRQGARATLPNGVDPRAVQYLDAEEDGMGPDGPEPDKRLKRNSAGPKTVEEFITNAPAGLRDPLAAMYRAHNAQKKEIVRGLVANENCRFTAEQLMARPLDELQMLSALAGTKKQAVAFNFAGLGDAGGTGQTQNTEPPLAVPVLNFSKRDDN